MGTRRGVGGGRERFFTLFFFGFVHVPIACFFFYRVGIPRRRRAHRAYQAMVCHGHPNAPLHAVGFHLS